MHRARPFTHYGGNIVPFVGQVTSFLEFIKSCLTELEGGSKRCRSLSVCPSVCLSVVNIDASLALARWRH